MNEHEPNPDDQDHEPPAEARPPVIITRKKRRWWVYTLAGLGGAVIMAVVLVSAGVVYWHSLVQRYTAAQPLALPRIESSDTALQALLFKWIPFQAAVNNGTADKPLMLSAQDLNACIAQNPKLQGRLWVSITNGQVFGRFTFSLDEVKQANLRDRHLNGVARLNLEFHGGALRVAVAELEANGKPVPGWLMKRLQKENLAKDAQRNAETAEFLRRLDRIQVQGDRIVLSPPAS